MRTVRIVVKALLAVACVVWIGASIGPARAACTTARTVGARGAYLVSNPDWGGAGGTRECTFAYGCYQSDPGLGSGTTARNPQRPPISAAFSGSFWAFPGYGNPGPGGIDNGTWDATYWSKQRSADFASGPYYYAAFLTLDTGGNFGPANPFSWGSDARIDGCITDAFNPGAIDPEECTCVLITDEWDGVGYFAVLSSFTDAIGDFDITPGTSDVAGSPTIRLSPLSRAMIVDSNSPDRGATMNFVANAGVLDPASLQIDGACDCGIAYKVYSWRTARGSLAPTSRDTFCATADDTDCWAEALAADGSAQQPTPIDGNKADAAVRVDCDPSQDEDLYLATRLVLDPASSGGFAAGNVSANSFQVACGNTSNLAEPNRPDPGRTRGRSDQAPRGRDGTRQRGSR